MRFCIVGAGAIGGFVGARLSLAGNDVTFIARGKNLDAINLIRPDLYRRLNPMRYELARLTEVTLAQRLRYRGYAVWQA